MKYRDLDDNVPKNIVKKNELQFDLLDMKLKHKSLVKNHANKMTVNDNDSEEKANDSLNEEFLLDKFNREEINKEFRKKFKKYYLFKVLKTPCV